MGIREGELWVLEFGGEGSEALGGEAAAGGGGGGGGGVGGVRLVDVRLGCLLFVLLKGGAECIGMGETRERSAALLSVRGLTAESGTRSRGASLIWVSWRSSPAVLNLITVGFVVMYSVISLLIRCHSAIMARKFSTVRGWLSGLPSLPLV